MYGSNFAAAIISVNNAEKKLQSSSSSLSSSFASTSTTSGVVVSRQQQAQAQQRPNTSANKAAAHVNATTKPQPNNNNNTNNNTQMSKLQSPNSNNNNNKSQVVSPSTNNNAALRQVQMQASGAMSVSMSMASPSLSSVVSYAQQSPMRSSHMLSGGGGRSGTNTPKGSYEIISFKNKLLSDLNWAIQLVQKTYLDGGHQPLTNSDYQSHALCQQFDFIFLFGLKNVNESYLKMMLEFTHKNVIGELNSLLNISTSFGRGRAWLYHALNDNLMESYLRCMLENRRLVDRFYKKNASLLSDDQAIATLSMLTSGLENVSFKLNNDVPYLDHSCWPTHLSMKRQFFDLVLNSSPHSLTQIVDLNGSFNDSLISMQSSTGLGVIPASILGKPQLSILRSDSRNDKNDQGDTASLGLGFNESSSSSLITGKAASSARLPSASLTKPKSQTRVRLKTESSIADADLPTTSASAKSTANTPTTTTTTTSKIAAAAAAAASGAVEADDHLEVTIKKKVKKASTSSAISDRKLTTSVSITSTQAGGLASASSYSGGSFSSSTMMPISSLDTSMLTSAQTKTATTASTMPSINVISSSLKSTSFFVDEEARRPRFDSSSEPPALPTPAPAPTTAAVRSSELAPSEPVRFSLSDEFTTTNTTNTITNEASQKAAAAATAVEANDRLDDDDIYNEEYQEPASELLQQQQQQEQELDRDRASLKSTSTSSMRTVNTNNNNNNPSIATDENASVRFDTDSNYGGGGGGSEAKSSQADSSSDNYLDCETNAADIKQDIRVDNNTKLMLMIDIFQNGQNEVFVKFYHATRGHNQGELEHIYLLISSYGVYILSDKQSGQQQQQQQQQLPQSQQPQQQQQQQQVGDDGRSMSPLGAASGINKYEKQAFINHKQIDYIEISMCDQAFHIVCINKRNNYWVTAGSRKLTERILESLQSARLINKVLKWPKLQVFYEATQQKLAIKKFISTVENVTSQDIEIRSYSLIYWEDQSVESVSPLIHKEGNLFYFNKQSALASLSGAEWKKAYFVLKNDILTQYKSSSDKRPVQVIKLSGEDFSGCRKNSASPRAHTIELILANSNALYLSAKSESEASDWLQCFCKIISLGNYDTNATEHSCLPCCSIVTSTKVYFCHEDFNSAFYRLLDSINLQDIDRISFDNLNPYYCILHDDSTNGKSSRNWFVYFVDETERNGFISSLKNAWEDIHQVTLAVETCKSSEMRKRCIRCVRILHKAWELSDNDEN